MRMVRPFFFLFVGARLSVFSGDPMFNAISVTLMCDACRQKGLLECPHNEHEIPHWKRDKKRSKLVQSIMSKDKAMYLRENAGLVGKQENNAFSLDAVDLLSISTYKFLSASDIRAPIFVCIDTAGGGSSCTAVCAGIFTPSHSLVVSAPPVLKIHIDGRHVRNKRDQVGVSAIREGFTFLITPFMRPKKKLVQILFQFYQPRLKDFWRTSLPVKVLGSLELAYAHQQREFFYSQLSRVPTFFHL
jgi:hypothetical protein